MTSPRKRAANRQNAQKSTGPRTPEGKARSAQNARAHGLAAPTASESLPPSQREAYEQELAAWTATLQPDNDPDTPLDPDARAAAEEAAWAAHQLRSYRRHALAATKIRLRNAADNFNLPHFLRFQQLILELPEFPERTYRQLLLSPWGIRWLIDRWSLIRLDLVRQGYLSLDDCRLMIQLIGHYHHGYRMSTIAAQICALCVHSGGKDALTEPEPPDPHAHILTPELRALLNLPPENPPVDPEAEEEKAKACAEILRFIDANLETLKNQCEWVKQQFDEDFEDFKDVTLLDASRDSAHLLRYQVAHSRSLQRARQRLDQLRSHKTNPTAPPTPSLLPPGEGGPQGRMRVPHQHPNPHNTNPRQSPEATRPDPELPPQTSARNEPTTPPPTPHKSIPLNTLPPPTGERHPRQKHAPPPPANPPGKPPQPLRAHLPRRADPTVVLPSNPIQDRAPRPAAPPSGSPPCPTKPPPTSTPPPPTATASGASPWPSPEASPSPSAQTAPTTASTSSSSPATPPPSVSSSWSPATTRSRPKSPSTPKPTAPVTSGTSASEASPTTSATATASMDPQAPGTASTPAPSSSTPPPAHLSCGRPWGLSGQRPRRSLVNRSLTAEIPPDAPRPPHIPLEDSILYELHVRGYTADPSSNVRFRGTYAGLAEKLQHLKNLGVTTVELMPIDEFDELDCPFTNPKTEERLRNFWGYNTVAYAAPKAAYAVDPEGSAPWEEFRAMVRDFHAAGLEVVLDVVFNHTAEGNDAGLTYSYRGIDNSLYYMLDDKGRYLNYSGCGNTVNTNHPVVRNLILDGLRDLVAGTEIDGLRFDLASVFGRDRRGHVLVQPPVIEEISDDGLLADTKLIAEPWDAAGLYQLESFPGGGRWSVWNGRFRDDVRRFWRGDLGMISDLASRLCGSDDLFKNLSPLHSINFITCHDGFTLHDLVAYNHKHNEANGEGNRDGCSSNWSWNCGVEGPTTDPDILDLRRRQAKNLLATLLLAQGVPMLLGGDEFLRTQGGNNNAWCQDNPTSWVDWSLAEPNADMLRFTREMIALRKRHHVLRRRSFFPRSGAPALIWHGVYPARPDWSYTSRTLAFSLDGRRGDRPDRVDRDIYVAMNAHADPITFRIPASPSGRRWRRAVDTARPAPEDILPHDSGPIVPPLLPYPLPSRSLLVLISED